MSIREIAEKTGLSMATVSNVLNGTRATSEESQRKVFAAAREIGYRPNLAARMLRTQKSNTVALVIPTDEINRNANFFYMDVLLGVNKKLSEANYNVIVASYSYLTRSGERSLGAVDICRKQWVDGIIFVPSSKNAKQLDVLKEMDIPFVLVDRKVDGGGYSFVGSDNEGGAFAAVTAMAEGGKKRIGFIGGALSVSSGSERFAGYRRAIESSGLEFCDELLGLADRYSVEQGEACAAKLLDRGVDGIFVGDNVLTMGAIKEITRRGLKVPDEVGVVGYDYFNWMSFTTPPITAVKQNTYQMGYVAAELLMRKLNGMAGNERIALETELVRGGSHVK